MPLLLPSTLEGEGLRVRGAVSRLRKNKRRNDKKLDFPLYVIPGLIRTLVFALYLLPKWIK